MRESKDCPAEVSQWLPRVHSLVVGPGLGRTDLILDNARNIIEQAKERSLPLVIDADGLYLITEDPYIISGYERAILTPNVVEFDRLYEKVVGEAPMQSEPVVNVKTLCEKMGNVTIVQKGENDIISDGKKGNSE
ncbi:ATP-dependent (S)-NAD(P)H-hydrate dehydratase-like [Mercenaria mercenaria]|uniref:ATP-dependent (S)-NAD(P)H-hydrate dehydratase-like n=1 Tax=Mercenaria mercenaria TaxID=6596 RepID=UPI00234F2BA1|nr:ATP-dependent (S)-NAD(P)H-hydrate dehydratase-like [Mercenaria mercenaria]